MHIDIVGLIYFFERYGENGFTSAIISAKKIAGEMEIKLKFYEKRVIRRKTN